MSKTKITIRYKAALLLFLLILQLAQTPIAAAFSLQAVFGKVILPTDKKRIGIVAILVEDSLLKDQTKYVGISNLYPKSLAPLTLADRIRRYALDVQKSQPFTKSLILSVNKNEPTENIAWALEKLYLEGDGTAGEINRLTGIVIIGDVPLPVINKGGNRYPSIFPYIDFEDKTFIYDAVSKDFIPNPSVIEPKADVWQGLIVPPLKGAEGNNLLAYYLDKNYLFHCRATSCAADATQFQHFTKKLLYMDLINEFALMDKQGFGNYLRYLANWENLIYHRYSKYLAKKLATQANADQKSGDNIDNDGDGKIDEDPENGIDDDGDGEAGSPLYGLADGVDNDGNGVIDEPAEGRFGICDYPTPITSPQKLKDCSIPGVPLMTFGPCNGNMSDPNCAPGNYYNVKPGSIYKVADGIDNNNDGFVDEKIDEDNGDAFKGIDNDRDGMIDEDTSQDNDADHDGKVDEDPPGDKNGDGCPGECGVDENMDSYDFDNDGYPNGYETKYGSLIAGQNVPTNPNNPSSIPLNLTGFPFLRLTPVPNSHEFIDNSAPADDDEDGKVDEDGTADNDNDHDGQVDEDPGDGSVSSTNNGFDTLPDIQSKPLIEKLAAPYNSLFDKFLANVNDWVGYTGRWDPSYNVKSLDPITLKDIIKPKSDVSTAPGLITMKDEYVSKYLRKVADAVEIKIDSFAENKSNLDAPQLEAPVAMLRGSKIINVKVIANNGTMDNLYNGKEIDFVNFARHLYTNNSVFPPVINQESLYINGKAVNEITSTKDCSLYRGSNGIPQNSIMVIASHLYNAFAKPDPATDAKYAGCVIQNYEHPERCFTFGAEKPLFDILGTKEVNGVSESETNYRACFDFKEKTRYDTYLQEVANYLNQIAAMDNEEARKTVPMPGSPYLPADQIVLADLTGSVMPPPLDVVIKFSDLLAKWGQGDKTDNNGNGIVDEVAEGVPQYGVNQNDWKQIGDRILQGRDINNDGFPEPIQYVFKGTPYLFPKVKEVDLTVVPDIALDNNGNKIRVSSFSANKEPTNSTLAAQSKIGMSPLAMPIDNPRFFTFKDKKGVFHKIKYPNLFAVNSLEELRQVLEAKEQELQKIADENGVNLRIAATPTQPGALTSLIDGATDLYADPGKLILTKASANELRDAYEWKKMNIDQKHRYILEKYLSPNQNAYVGETPNGYEALYLVAKGDGATLKMNFNGDFTQEDPDIDLLKANQQKDPEPTSPNSSPNSANSNGGGQGGGDENSSATLKEPLQALLNGIDIMAWYGEMQKWLYDTIHNTGFSKSANACSVSDAPGDYFDQQNAEGDSDGDGVPDSQDNNPLNPDSDGDNIPDGAQDTVKFRITADKTVLKTGASDTMNVTVEGLSADDKPQKGDSFTQVKLVLTAVNEAGKPIIKPAHKLTGLSSGLTGALKTSSSTSISGLPADINSTNPTSLDRGKAVFTLTSNNIAGKFKITAESPNRASIKSNSLTVESTNRKIRLVSYLQKDTLPYVQQQLSGFIIKDSAEKIIAEVDGKTGMITIKDDRFELGALPSKGPKAARLVVREKSTGKIYASVFFVADKTIPISVDNANTEYLTDFLGMKGVHLKDLNPADNYAFSVTGSNAAFNAGNGYITMKTQQASGNGNGASAIKNIGIVQADGNIFLAPDLKFSYKDPINSASPVIFVVSDKNGNPLFEIYIGADFPMLEIIKEEGEFSDFNLLAALLMPAARSVAAATRTIASAKIAEESLAVLKRKLLAVAHAAPVLDTDKDGLNDLEEMILGTQYNNSDTDGDSFKDGDELLKNYDPLRANEPLFNDLKIQSKGFTDIIKLLKRGVVQISQNHLFYPATELTREEFVQLDLGTICINCVTDKLNKKMKKAIDMVYAQSPFPDKNISPNLSYCIKEAKNRQIVSGYKGGTIDGFFVPKSLISRAEAAKVVLETTRQQTGSTIELMNEPTTGKPWYYNYILAAQKIKLFPRGYFLELDTYSPEEFKKWFDVQLVNHGPFIKWLEGNVRRDDFAIMVSKLIDTYDCTQQDSDNDGIPDNYEQYMFGTNPLKADSDGGGVNDIEELTKGSDPNISADDKLLTDPDNDGLTNLAEEKYETNPNEADTDKGGVKDGDEVKNGTNPLDAKDDYSIDSDNDGIPDFWEMKYSLNPYDAADANLDPDEDGLTNLEEYHYGTDPKNADTDGGGVNDGDEVLKSANPLDASDDNAKLKGKEGAYIVGNTVFPNYTYAAPASQNKQGGALLEYSDQMPADGASKLFLKASILNDHGDTDLTDSASTVRFFATEGGSFAKLLYSTVRAVKGEAVTEIQSTTTAGIFNASASITGKDIPVDDHPIYVTPLEPATIALIPESNVIRSGGLSTTNLHVELRDVNGNIVNNGAYTVTFKVTGAGSLEGVTDEDAENEGTQVTTVNGTFDLTVKSSENPGTINVTAVYAPPAADSANASSDGLTTDESSAADSAKIQTAPATSLVIKALTAVKTLMATKSITAAKTLMTTKGITAQTSISSRDDIKISLKPARSQIPSDFNTVTKIDLQVTDRAGNIINGFAGKADFNLMKETYGKLLGETSQDITAGRAEIVFQSSNIAGDALIQAIVPGFEPANTVITTLPKEPKKILLEAPAQTLENSTAATLQITAKLYDADGNFAYNDSTTLVTFKITDASKKFAAFATAPVVKAENGKAAVTIRGTDTTGPINIVAMADGLKNGVISLTSVELFHGQDFKDLAPQVLFGSLLGSDFGNIFKDNYLGGWFVFSGRTEAAVSLLTPPKPATRIAEFTKNGQIKIFDPDNYSLRFSAANGEIQPNLFILSDAVTKKDLAEMFMVLKPQSKANAVKDAADLENASEGIYVALTSPITDYALNRVANGLSLSKKANEKVRVKDDGRVLIFDNSFTVDISENNSGHYMTLAIRDSGSEIAKVVFVNNFFTDVKELSLNTVIDMTASSYPSGIYVHRLGEYDQIGYEPSFSGNSTALPKGLYVTDKDTPLPASQAPGLNYVSLEQSDEEPGIGFKGENKHMLLFAAGNSVGESNLPYASDAGIVLGDPTVRLNNKIGSPDNYLDYQAGMSANGFTKDIGKEIFTGDAPIKDLVQIDYNHDGLRDVLVAYENGQVRLLQNNQSYPRFTDRGIFLNFPAGIQAMVAGDFNGDGLEDLVVATEESCKRGEVCVDLYQNDNGNFVRQNLNLQPFTAKNRVYMMRAADMNNDGAIDLITSDDSGTVRVFYSRNGTLDQYGQYVGSLGVHVDNTKNLFQEVLVAYDGSPVNQPGTADDLNFAQFMVPGEDNNLAQADKANFAKLRGLGNDMAKVSANLNLAEKTVDFTYLDLDPRLGPRSSKLARDLTQPFNVIEKGDQIEYTITLRNDTPGATNLHNVMISDVLSDSVTFNKGSQTCEGCGDAPLKMIETGKSLNPYIFGPFDLKAGKSIVIKYSVTAKNTPRVNINVGQNLDSGYPKDDFADIAASPEGNTSGRMTYFYSISKDPQSQKIIYGTYVTPPPDIKTGLPSSQGGIDFNKLSVDNDHNGLPDEIENYQKQKSKEDEAAFNDSSSALDGAAKALGVTVASLGDAYDYLSGGLDKIGDDIEAALNAFTCSGGCIPLPINFAFFAPGMINMMGMPGGFDPGLPIFGWGAPPLGFVWPPMPYQGTAGGRIYLSPTLTMSMVMSVCLGPYLAGQCWSFKLGDLLSSERCDEIAGGFNKVIAGANAVAQSLGNDGAVSSDGSATGADSSGRQSTGGWTGSASLGNYQYKASVSTNFRIPGFPSVITDWLDRQTEEVVNKLTDLPDIYFIYPDVTSLVGIFVPQDTGQQSGNSQPKPASELPKPKKWTSFRQVLNYINSIPLVQIQSREVLVKIPALTQKEIEKVQNDSKQWIEDERNEVNRVLALWCGAPYQIDENWQPLSTPPGFQSEYASVCDKLLLDMTALVKSVEKNIEVLEKYKELPRKILAWRNITAKYINQIICLLDAIMKYTGGYISKQQQRIEAWIEMIRKVKQTINDWKAIVDLTINYQASCDRCSTARLTLMELLLKLFAVIPSPPIIPFPKLPDLYIDVSKIQTGLKILWPDIKFRPEPLIIPKLPRVLLPDIPTLKITLPPIPVIPDPPNIPLNLPDIPMLPFPNLPDIPPPPKVPNLPVSVKITISILQKIIRILCLLKKGLIPVPESMLKSHVEQLTERPLSPLLPIDLGFKMQMPAIKYDYVDRIQITTYLNFQLDFEGIYNFVKKIADMANVISTDLVKQVNEMLKAAAVAAQEAAEAPATEGNKVTGGDKEFNVNAQELRLTAQNTGTAESPSNKAARASDFSRKSTAKSRSNQDSPSGAEKMPLSATGLAQYQAVNDLAKISPVLGELTAELISASNAMKKDAQKYEAMSADLKDIKLEVKQRMLAKTDPILNRPIAQIKAERSFDYPVEFPIQKRMMAMRDTLIAYIDDQDALLKKLEQAGDAASYGKILADLPTLDSYLGSIANDSLFGQKAVATITPENIAAKTGGTVIQKFEGSLLRDFGEKIMSQLTAKKSLLADIAQPDVPSTPGTTGNTPSYKGIFVFNAATGSNARLMNYTEEADKPTKLMFIDMDNDGDNDILVAIGGNIYLKENYKLYPSAEYNSYVGDPPPPPIEIAQFIPAMPAVNGFAANFNNNRSVELSWAPAQNPLVSGYEISYKLVPDAFTQKLGDTDYKLTIVSQTAQPPLEIPADATFKPDNVSKDYMIAENVSGEVYFDGTERTFVVANAQPVEVRPGLIIHTLTDSSMSFSLATQDEGNLNLPGNSAFSIPASYTTPLKLNVNSGAVEIINPQKTSTHQKLLNGMRVDYDSTLSSENGGSATVRFGDGAYTRLDANGRLTLKLLESAQTPSVKLVLPNGFYYAKISAFARPARFQLTQGGSLASGRFTSTPSAITLMAPTLCGDKQSPMPNAGPAQRTVSIFKPLVLDASKSFDANGNIVAYWIDTDLTKDNNMDGDPTNDKDLGHDADVASDFDGDGIANNDLDDPIFTLGPYNDLRERKVELNVMDEAGNVSGQEITIKIYVPGVKIADSTAQEGVVRGTIDPTDKDIPITVIRDRGGVMTKIKTPKANPYGKYLTNANGEFMVDDLNLKDSIIISNSKDQAIGEINVKTGRIVLYDSSYTVSVLPAEQPLLPTRLVVKDKNGNVITTLFIVPDMNTDATVDPPTLPYNEATTALFKGAHVKDTNPLDDFEFKKIPADDQNYPGGVAIVEKSTDKRAAIIDTGGSFYVLDNRLSLRLKNATNLDDPLVMEIIFTPQGGMPTVLGEFFIAAHSGNDLQIVSSDKFKVFVEGAKTHGPLYDTDKDGMPDQWELTFGLNPRNPSDAVLDPDNDGLTNLEEYQTGANPLNPDSDGDGYTDGQEIIFAQNPTKKATSPYADVGPKNPYFRSILDLGQRNILKGVARDGKMLFLPDAPISRAEFTRIILEIFCIIPRKEAYEDPQVFTDIPYTPANLPWYYAITKEAFMQGLITGYLGAAIDKKTGMPPFKPDATINRAEATKIIIEALNRFGVIDMGKIPDTGSWYGPFITIAQDLTPYLKNKNYLKKPFLLTAEEAAHPEKLITRAEFVAMADRVLTAYDCTTIDTDDDGMPDYWEKKYGLNPLDPSDANLDPDGDGLTNLLEYKHGTDPRNPDTDLGGVSDGDEVKKGTNPRNDPLDDPIDTDGDGLTDKAETNVFHTNPQVADTDGGGVSDGDEVLINNTNPLNPADDKDVDGDGLSNFDEIQTYHTDPLNPDTDGGGVKDGDEVYRGTDPLNPNDDLIDPRSDLKEGIYLIQEDCDQCPCPAAIKHTADLIPGDKVFGVISNNDESEIFSKSNEVEILLIPKPTDH